MNDKTSILSAIYRAIDEINKQLPPDKKLARDESAPINVRALDSLHMVNFLLGVEEQLQLDCGLQIDLGASLSPTAEVPFATVSELAGYIQANARNTDA